MAVAQELVVHLSDIVLRRSTRAIEGKLRMEGLCEVGGIAAAGLGWTEQRLAAEIDVVTSLKTSMARAWMK
ncbi:hypothetical protein [Rhizobium leguminosarum]|uniref:hypothetical protein n=1 Tax=Rhizobium leguminosarum TaxID=384 RepID=UPI001C9657E0|nr:hypothetical protein [Rhizobium leguminosarum]MBY5403448.1 hypothetical protein [Rhizobium leguminosarum]